VAETIKSILRGAVGSYLISLYLRLVSLTTRHVHVALDPESAMPDGPVIYATWHGQNFIFAFYFKNGNHPTLLVAHHGDGRMVGQAMAYMGVPLVFGSGTTEQTDTNKGGARAALQLLKVLRSGRSITLTADVPKIARHAGPGIILIARKSGVPIVPVAMTTSRRKILKTWDKMQLPLPFGRMVFVTAPAIHVAGHLPGSPAAAEAFQAELNLALDAAQARAIAIADGVAPE